MRFLAFTFVFAFAGCGHAQLEIVHVPDGEDLGPKKIPRCNFEQNQGKLTLLVRSRCKTQGALEVELRDAGSRALFVEKQRLTVVLEAEAKPVEVTPPAAQIPREVRLLEVILSGVCTDGSKADLDKPFRCSR